MNNCSILRIARPTDNLEEIGRMYCAGLDFKIIDSFEDHDGFDGVIIGRESCGYHLEFTHSRSHLAGRAPTQDNLLVFFEPDRVVWKRRCEALILAGFKSVRSFNPYWDILGKTFEDIDGYRVVIQNE